MPVCCCCGYEEPHGVIIQDHGKRGFACERCFEDPNLWFGFVKWGQQRTLIFPGGTKQHTLTGGDTFGERSFKKVKREHRKNATHEPDYHTGCYMFGRRIDKNAEDRKETSKQRALVL